MTKSIRFSNQKRDFKHKNINIQIHNLINLYMKKKYLIIIFLNLLYELGLEKEEKKISLFITI